MLKQLLHYTLKLCCLLLPCFSLLACQSANKPDTLVSISTRSAKDTVMPNYATVQKQVQQVRLQLKKTYKKDSPDKAGILRKVSDQFTSMFAEKILPYWFGTTWDFNGTSQQPGEGAIACGYFVTTLLRDMDYSLNRVKLAQCASGKIISSLVSKNHHKNFSHLTFEAFIAEIKKAGKGCISLALIFIPDFYCTMAKRFILCIATTSIVRV
jgi:ABC-type uncharacterized transport system auxiliary subunit